MKEIGVLVHGALAAWKWIDDDTIEVGPTTVAARVEITHPGGTICELGAGETAILRRVTHWDWEAGDGEDWRDYRLIRRDEWSVMAQHRAIEARKAGA